jgi:CheY-like chemotaxis protein
MKSHREKLTAAVLVVEDEPLLRAYVCDVLGQSGFDVVEAFNAEEAMEQLASEEKPICAMVSDVAMPGKFDGFELARRAREEYPRVGVVLISGVHDPRDIYIPLGVRFLSKPVRVHTLLRLVREVADPRAKLPEMPVGPGI